MCRPCHLRTSNHKATLHHIIAGCRIVLEDRRYTWRHDSVIATLLQAIQPILMNHNANPPAPTPIPTIYRSFVPAGSEPTQRKRIRPNRSLLGHASDWKLLVDFHHKPYLFPLQIFPTQERDVPTCYYTPTHYVSSSLKNSHVLLKKALPRRKSTSKLGTSNWPTQSED